MEIVFVRHGEPAWDHGDDRTDPPLTARGAAQAGALAGRLAAEGPWDRLFVSPLRRARETAAPIEASVGIESVVVADLAEIDLGDRPDDTAEVILREYRDWLESPPERWAEPLRPESETLEQFHDRVTAAIDGLLAGCGVGAAGHPRLWDTDRSAERVVVVAHGGTNAVAVAHLLGLPRSPFEWERFLSPHAGMAKLVTRPLGGVSAFALCAHGDIAHLDEGTY